MTMSDHERMMQMINGYWVSQIVSAAAAYSLADLFADGPATAEEIAQKARTVQRRRSGCSGRAPHSDW